MVVIIRKEVLSAIDKGIVCPICNLGYLKVDKIYIKKENYKERIICSNCYKELQIVCQTNPFKIFKINEMK